MPRFPLRSVAGAAIVVLIGAAVVLADRPQQQHQTAVQQDESSPPLPENPAMNSPAKTAHAIPPIDRATPKTVETATFAMG